MYRVYWFRSGGNAVERSNTATFASATHKKATFAHQVTLRR